MFRVLFVSISFLLLFGCDSKKEEDIKNPAIIMEGEAYGSTFRIVYYSYDRNWNVEIQEIMEEFDNSVNTYTSSSFLSKFNKSERGSKADKMLIELVELSRNYNTVSNGYFDPSVSPLSDLWGFSPSGIKNLPTEQQVDSVMTFVGLENVLLESDSLGKRDPRVALNFNAMTGYVNDQIAQFLDEKKVESYLIEIGGEMIAKGKKPNGDSWLIGIDEPMEKSPQRELNSTLVLENEAMATSGNYRKFHIDEKSGKKIVHIINPLSGYPETSALLSASVIAPTCAEADAIATALMSMGLEKAKEYTKARPDLKFYLIWSDESGEFISEAYNGFEVLNNSSK